MENGLKKSDYFYDLPPELIAQHPLEKRDASRLLHLDKATGEVEHRTFRDILQFLKPDDCLVLNNTKVIPARLYGKRTDTGGVVEVLLLRRRELMLWECLVKPGKKARPGMKLSFGEGLLYGEIKDIVEEGNRLIEFFIGDTAESNGRLNESEDETEETTGNEGSAKKHITFEEVLDCLGEMPLPPYITEKLEDQTRYQTVYAKYDGSAAAPTAGLHFTPELLKEVEDLGVNLCYVTLHVGLGTFRPVKEENILDHKMHTEWYEVSGQAADLINQTKEKGGRVICVGTTSCRTIESAADPDGKVKAGSAETGIFIYPGYQFKVLDGLITNFHLPESTLIMLVSALAGREKVLAAYEEAVRERYRFFSLGDAMLII